MRAPRTTSLCVVALALVAWAGGAQAQRVRPRRQLTVLRDYDGNPSVTAAPLALDIVRNYDGQERMGPAPAPIAASMSPWDGDGTATPAVSAMPLALVTVYDEAGTPTRPVHPFLLLAYDGAEIVRTVRDPAVHLLSVITDFDAQTGVQTSANVYVAYDEAGGVLRVETALPPVNVPGSSEPVGSGPMITVGRAITTSRTISVRPALRRAVRPRPLP